jgi:hypothetical protein
MLLWVLTILLVGALCAMLLMNQQRVLWYAWSSLASAVSLLLYLGIASQASRLLVAARRNGMMELLLATPLTAREIVQGQWRALLRMFGTPLAICMMAQFIGGFAAQQMTWKQMAALPASAPASATTNTASNPPTSTTITVRGGRVISSAGFTPPSVLFALATALSGALTVAANLVALMWFGMWMGVTSTNTNVATLKTIIFVQVIPAFVIGFASSIVIALVLLPTFAKGTGGSGMMVWFPALSSVLATTLYLGKDIAFTVWSRAKLYSEFRERAVRAVAPVQLSLPPPLPATVSPPAITDSTLSGRSG